MKNLLETEKAYLAGILDGEGCVGLVEQHRNRKKTTLFPFVQIGNTNKQLIDWVSDAYGKSMFAKDDRWRKPLYLVNITSITQANEVLKIVLPYLIVKRRQAELLIEFCEIRLKLQGNYRQNPQSTREREIYEELRRLNQKGRKA